MQKKKFLICSLSLHQWKKSLTTLTLQTIYLSLKFSHISQQPAAGIRFVSASPTLLSFSIPSGSLKLGIFWKNIILAVVVETRSECVRPPIPVLLKRSQKRFLKKQFLAQVRDTLCPLQLLFWRGCSLRIWDQGLMLCSVLVTPPLPTQCFGYLLWWIPPCLACESCSFP